MIYVLQKHLEDTFISTDQIQCSYNNKIDSTEYESILNKING